MDAEEIVPLIVLKDSGEHVIAGGGAVTDIAAVPLNATRKPSVADGQVARLDHGIPKHQIIAVFLVVQRIQTTAVFGQKFSAEVLVFENEALHFQRDPLSRIPILHQIRQGLDMKGQALLQLIGKRLVELGKARLAISEFRQGIHTLKGRARYDLDFGCDLHDKLLWHGLLPLL